jgi:hypothetical protein
MDAFAPGCVKKQRNFIVVGFASGWFRLAKSAQARGLWWGCYIYTTRVVDGCKRKKAVWHRPARDGLPARLGAHWDIGLYAPVS